MESYELKLDYTADELQELKRLGKNTKSPINATGRIADIDYNSDKFKNLQLKYLDMDYKDEFDFMTDINNMVMGTAILPDDKYVVHDSTTGKYIYYNATEWRLCWGEIGRVRPEIKTKDEWLEISPAYELMLESVEE